MEIKSDNFTNNGIFPTKNTCDGDKTNPSLVLSGIPKNTESLAFIFEDPDAPSGTFIHWVMWDIKPVENFMKEGELPDGTTGINTAGGNDYFPPCPPNGTHRYIFTVYALSSLLSLPDNSGKNELLRTMEGKVIESANITGLYARAIPT